MDPESKHDMSSLGLSVTGNKRRGGQPRSRRSATKIHLKLSNKKGRRTNAISGQRVVSPPSSRCTSRSTVFLTNQCSRFRVEGLLRRHGPRLPFDVCWCRMRRVDEGNYFVPYMDCAASVGMSSGFCILGGIGVQLVSIPTCCRGACGQRIG